MYACGLTRATRSKANQVAWSSKTTTSDSGDGVPSPRLLTSTLKCLALLDALAEQPNPVRLSDLARECRASRSTVHQQLATLVEAGWVDQTADSRYRLSLRATGIAEGALRQAGLGDRVRPVLERLARDTGEAVSISVLHNASAFIVQRVESGHLLRLDLVTGTRMPLRTSASGRVLTAFAPPETVAALRASHVDVPTDSDLSKVRTAGYAVSANDYIDGIAAVAAPMFTQAGMLQAALSLAGPATRFDAYGHLEPLLQARDALAKTVGVRALPSLIPPESGRFDSQA